MPTPIAEVAIKRGVAIEADTDAAREKMAEMAELRARRVSPRLPAVTVEDTVDLGVDWRFTNFRRRSLVPLQSPREIQGTV